ncbi:MAG: ABC transporter ATP-binding protein [Bacteroidetes bacterium]|nr:ABC transporter ATP-binding protein [Bacteroidota bacterium]
MNKVAIQVDDIWKQYRLGSVGTGSLGNDLRRMIARVRGKEDPFLKVGDINDRTKKGNSDYVWALRNVSFEVSKGEVLGIVGRNGAGKSTLLKILSRVTAPTRGQIRVRGKMAALLEVGTGFHQDLSGRENIFLNGTIMGMSIREVKKKFDEIVDFSGVERYIDTPVKRYSSGMYVRLAFAVAAHLDPEILIIDEVLSVGDAEFQRKCLGKMKDVSSQGRTVLFVSHNMSAVNNLCKRTIWMENGSCAMQGDTLDVVAAYLDNSDRQTNDENNIYDVPEKWERPWGRRDAVLKRIEMHNPSNDLVSQLFLLQPFSLIIHFNVEKKIENAVLQIRIATVDGQQITYSGSNNYSKEQWNFEPGDHAVKVEMDPKLMPGKYSFFIYFCNTEGTVFYDAIGNFLRFQVKNISEGDVHVLSAKINTFIHLPCKWEVLN